MNHSHPIGIFDSGFGGLTVMKEIVNLLPTYDYIYLGDNARTPYGTRSFEAVYRYTLEAVRWLFSRGCPLIILACNTASAKALRTIQQTDLPSLAPSRRVLGVIRPVTEIVGALSKTGHIGLLATPGTVRSQSYTIEVQKIFPTATVVAEACPLWVPLVESNETESEGTEFFVRKHLDQLLARDPEIDTIILGCTHYPLLTRTIRKFLPEGVIVVNQGSIVAESLSDYLKRHPEIASECSRNGQREFFTTDCSENFNELARLFYGEDVDSMRVELT